MSRLIQVFTNGFTGIVIWNKKKVYCSDLSISQGGEQTCFLSEGGLTVSKLPVSANVKLIYPLIKWRTIEMSVRVIQQRAIETSGRGGFFDKMFIVSEEVFSPQLVVNET